MLYKEAMFKSDFYKPGIYSASKIWHNTKWQYMRDNFGYAVTSRWINCECGTYDNPSGAKQFNPMEKRQLWIECAEDITKADMTICYGEERDDLKGAVMEMGMTLGERKPVYVIGDCKFFRPDPRSDAAFMHHPLVHRVSVGKNADGSFDFVEGYASAVKHYLETYHNPERFFRNTPFLNADFTSSFRGLHKAPAYS